MWFKSPSRHAAIFTWPVMKASSLGHRRRLGVISRPVLHGAVMGGVAASQKQLPDDKAPKSLAYRWRIYCTALVFLVWFHFHAHMKA